MVALPSGTVTLVFTDIEGSTHLVQEFGERYAEVLAEHRQVLRDAFSRNDGVEVDTQGDSFFAVFARAADAVAAARDLQAGLAGGAVRVRVGVHTGEPLVTDEGYVGVDVHRAARVMGAAHGGQVLLSETTQRLLDSTVAVRDLGEHRLKDLTAPQRLYQLGGEVFPPPRTLYRSTLPIQSSPLVGRERELKEAGALLRSQRLITLIGPGGSGKTRLALQLAAEAVEEFPDGVFWVGLQALQDSTLVERAIAETVGADDSLFEHLADKRVLLLLDNFEQVIEAASTIASLLGHVRHAKLLVTSREPLQIASERRYPVEPLPERDALALFIERAQAVVPVFSITPAVQEICRRLDHLPLAIELAAARVALLEPDDLLARLERTLPLLTSASRDAPERQRTLRGTIAWSYHLLAPSEQELLQHLAVFSGSFSIEAAEAICDAELHLLESLVVKSLLRRLGDGRLGMLTTIREYALERLEETTEADAIRRRHAEFFLELARGANLNPNTYDPAKPIRHDLARREQNEIYAAMAWAEATNSVVLGLRLASAIGGWLWSINRPDEGLRYLDKLTKNADLGTVPPDVLADALREHAAQAFLTGDNLRAEQLNEQALRVYEQLGDDHGRAVMLHRLGLSALWSGDHRRARAVVEESHAIHQRRSDHWGISQTLGALGAIARDTGDERTAEKLFSQSAAIARDIGGGFADWWACGTLAELASLSFTTGQLEEAAAHAKEALALADQLHYRGGRVFGVGVLAAIAARRHRCDLALKLWTAIEDEDAVAPLGGWRRHRRVCEAAVQDACPDHGSDSGTERLPLDEAVQLALEGTGGNPVRVET